MMQDDSIIGIYTALENNLEGSYKLLHLFDNDGRLEVSAGNSLFTDLVEVESFKSLDELNRYAFSLCDKLKKEKISLHSVEEYNQLLESSSTVSDLKEKLFSGGNIIKNVDFKKKSRFLGKLFN